MIFFQQYFIEIKIYGIKVNLIMHLHVQNTLRSLLITQWFEITNVK